MSTPRPAVLAYLGFGSNLGDRAASIARAIEALERRRALTVTRVSPLIETAPEGGADEPPYLNAAAEVETILCPRCLLAACLDIERGLGRRAPRRGPRPLDIDLLLYGREIIDEPGLRVPHPRMVRRPFVLVPLAAIAPQAVHPVEGRSIEWLRDALTGRPSPPMLDVTPTIPTPGGVLPCDDC